MNYNLYIDDGLAGLFSEDLTSFFFRNLSYAWFNYNLVIKYYSMLELKQNFVKWGSISLYNYNHDIYIWSNYIQIFLKQKKYKKYNKITNNKKLKSRLWL